MKEACGIKFLEQGKGKDLLFFHGMGVRPPVYQRLIDTLDSAYRIIAPYIDFPDLNSFTARLGNLSQKLEMKDLIAVGHSAGGLAAVHFAKEYSGKVRGLILIDSPVGGDPRGLGELFPEWALETSALFFPPDITSLNLLSDFVARTVSDPIGVYEEVGWVLENKKKDWLDGLSCNLLI